MRERKARWAASSPVHLPPLVPSASSEVFGGVNAGAGVEPCGVVDDLEKRLRVRVAGEPGVRGGVVLPERAEVADLPAANGFKRLLVAGVGGEVVGDGPAADAGAIGFEGKAAEQFACEGAVGRPW